MRADNRKAVPPSAATSTRRYPDAAPLRYLLHRNALKPKLAVSHPNDIHERQADPIKEQKGPITLL